MMRSVSAKVDRCIRNTRTMGCSLCHNLRYLEHFNAKCELHTFLAEGEGFLYEDRNQRSVWAKVKFVRRDNIDREKYTVTCLVKSLHRTK